MIAKRAFPLVAIGLLVACSKHPAEPISPSISSPPTAVSTAAPMSSGAPSGGVEDAAPPASTSAAAPPRAEVPSFDAGAEAAAPAPIDWKNQQPFTLSSDDLTARAKGLFEAIAHDDPSLGEAFWFPKEPFLPLKDVKGPDKYWDTLHGSYVEDIHALHRKRKSWEGAIFTSFTVGSAPKWVKPGEEANKIGYYRSFRGMIAYAIEGHAAEIEVRTMITWQGRWFVTHLRKVKH
jgi:hypothetical protein